jgi:hypothetical protein
MAIVKEKELIDFYFENLEKNSFGIEPEILDEGILSWLGGKLGNLWGEFSNGFKEGAGAKEKIESALERIGTSSPPGVKKLKDFLQDQDIANMPADKLGQIMNAFMKKLSPEEQKQVIEFVTGKKTDGEATSEPTSDKLGKEEEPLKVIKGTGTKLAPILTQVKDSAMRGTANNAIQLVIAAARKSKNKEEFLKTLSMKLFKNVASAKEEIKNNQ